MTRHLFAAPFAGFTILSPKRPYVPTMVQVRKPSVWHASSLNETLTADPTSVPTCRKSGGFHQHEPLGKRSSPPAAGHHERHAGIRPGQRMSASGVAFPDFSRSLPAMMKSAQFLACPPSRNAHLAERGKLSASVIRTASRRGVAPSPSCCLLPAPHS